LLQNINNRQGKVKASLRMEFGARVAEHGKIGEQV
jgi:hypothetical protein